jgi:hypothetical protein
MLSKVEGRAPDLSMPQLLKRLVHECTELWWESDADGLPPMPSYTPRDQSVREAHLQHFLDALTTEAKDLPRTESEGQRSQARILAAFQEFALPALDLDEHSAELLLSPSLVQAAIQFVQTARHFDPAVSDSSIFQASRNAWSMHGLQSLWGLPVQLTPSIFAYSMIYPYTDNYLDDPAIPAGAKGAFNESLARRLAGEDTVPANAHERAIWKLVGMIESQFARAQYPRVFDSLLAIHGAQCRSLSLLRQDASPYAVDVLGISLEKGGASVLADGYLVAGTLGPADMEYTFGLGAFLQLVDDLQDVEQDRRAGLATVFSQTAGRWPLDKLTSRTFSFGAKVLERLSHYDAPELIPLKELMGKSTFLLLLEAAGRAAKLHTRDYMGKLETHSPFRFAFLRRQHRDLSRAQEPLARLLRALAASTAEELPGPLPLP